MKRYQGKVAKKRSRLQQFCSEFVAYFVSHPKYCGSSKFFNLKQREKEGISCCSRTPYSKNSKFRDGGWRPTDTFACVRGLHWS